MAEAFDRDAQTCAQCGTGFSGRKRKYCNARCNWTAQNRLKGHRSLADHRADEHTKVFRECPECRYMFRITRHDTHSKGPQIHCSIDCYRADSRRTQAIERERIIYRQWSMAAKRRQREAQAGKQCRNCGAAVDKGAQRCEPCRTKAKVLANNTDAAKASRRAAKARRRAIERGIDAERFDPFEIFNRDGWRCHLCGCKTPKKLRGSYDNKAPELDHIIPLSIGGKHIRANVACSCRKCNYAKADRPLGQLILSL